VALKGLEIPFKISCKNGIFQDNYMATEIRGFTINIAVR
jgi:hypothetical protein